MRAGVLLVLILGAASACSSGGAPVPAAAGTVDCGDEAVRVFDPPGTLTCVATPAHSAPVRLAVTVSDTKGSSTLQPEQGS